MIGVETIIWVWKWLERMKAVEWRRDKIQYNFVTKHDSYSWSEIPSHTRP